MTEDQVKEILDRALTWPPVRQADVARIVEVMEQQNESDLQLSAEQADEMRRRVATPAAKNIAAEDGFRRSRHAVHESQV